MKKFLFKLETLLRLRIQLEKNAQMNLAAAKKRLDTAKMILAGIQELQKNAQNEFEQKKNSEKLHVEDFLGWHKYLRKIEIEALSQEKIIVEITEQIKILLKELEAAMKNRKVVEKLKAKKIDDYNQELLQEEQKMIDEIAVTRHKGSVW